MAYDKGRKVPNLKRARPIFRGETKTVFHYENAAAKSAAMRGVKNVPMREVTIKIAHYARLPIEEKQ
jgi:hypothetical protein